MIMATSHRSAFVMLVDGFHKDLYTLLNNESRGVRFRCVGSATRSILRFILRFAVAGDKTPTSYNIHDVDVMGQSLQSTGTPKFGVTAFGVRMLRVTLSQSLAC